MKVILSWFPEYLWVPRGSNQSWQQHEWDSWVSALKPYRSSIVAIYPYDEPYLAAIQKKVGYISNASRAERSEIMKAAKVNYETALGRIKEAFPGIPLIYVEAHVIVTEELQIPKGYDWIGTDCYDNWESCHGNSIPGYFKILESKLAPGQKLVAVLPGYVQESKASPIGAEGRQHLSDLIRKYGVFVRSDPRFAAALIWSYESFPREHGTELKGDRPNG